MATSTPKFNVYDHVTQTILQELEKGTVPWRAPWTGSTAAVGLPLRANGEAYRGINVLMLWVAAQVGGFGSATWMTYRQAQELGGQVRKGEKSSTVIKYGTIEVKGDDASGDSDTRAYSTKPKGIYFASHCYSRSGSTTTWQVGQKGDGYLLAVPLERYSPKQLSLVRERVEAEAEAIHAIMSGERGTVAQLQAYICGEGDLAGEDLKVAA